MERSDLVLCIAYSVELCPCWLQVGGSAELECRFNSDLATSLKWAQIPYNESLTPDEVYDYWFGEESDAELSSDFFPKAVGVLALLGIHVYH